MWWCFFRRISGTTEHRATEPTHFLRISDRRTGDTSLSGRRTHLTGHQHARTWTRTSQLRFRTTPRSSTGSSSSLELDGRTWNNSQDISNKRTQGHYNPIDSPASARDNWPSHLKPQDISLRTSTISPASWPVSLHRTSPCWPGQDTSTGQQDYNSRFISL